MFRGKIVKVMEKSDLNGPKVIFLGADQKKSLPLI